MIQQQARNLKSYLYNIPYDRKELVEEHILKVLKSRQSHFVQTGVAKNIDDSFYCYIHIIGWIEIGSHIHEIRILFPHNYPIAMPQFHLIHKPQENGIANESNLISNKIISLQTNDAEETIIRLDFPSVKNMWSHDRKNADDAYKEVIRCINSPPLLYPKQLHRPPPSGGSKPGNSSSKAEKFLTEAEMSGLMIESKKIQLETLQSENQASLARIDFLQRHLPKLSKTMKACEQEYNNKLKEVKSIGKDVRKGEFNSLLEMSEGQKQKINVMAKKQGLKEGEKRLIKFLEKSLPDNRVKLSDYRNSIKSLYQSMFQAQCSFLRLSD